MFPESAATIVGVYREFAPPPDLAAHVACVWTSVSRGGAIFPDGCVDIVWHGDRLVVAGPATGPVASSVPVGSRVFGVRFRLGVAGAALGLPAGELADETVPLADVWGPASTSASRRRAGRAGRRGPRARGSRAARSAGTGRGAADGGAGRARVGLDLGVSERQLRRRFEDAVGYGPKTLARVLRFQRFLALARAARSSPGWRCRRATPDQAHLTRECRRLSGRTPAELVAAPARRRAGRNAVESSSERRVTARNSTLARPIRSSRAARRGVPSGPMNETIERAQNHVWSTSRVLEQRRFEVLFGDNGDAERGHRRAGALQDAGWRLRLRARARRARADEPAAAHLDRARGARRRRHDRPRDLRSPEAISAPDGGLPVALPTLEPYARAPWWAHRDRGHAALHRAALRAALQARCHPRVGRHGRGVLLGRGRRDREDAPLRGRGGDHLPRRGARPRARERRRGAPRRAGRASRGWSASSRRATRRARSTTRTTSPARPAASPAPWFTDAEIEASLEHLAAQQREDGGWPVTWAIWLPAIEFEWSGLVTISALKILRAYGRI